MPVDIAHYREMLRIAREQREPSDWKQPVAPLDLALLLDAYERYAELTARIDAFNGGEVYSGASAYVAT
jgi:hypothetical protein